MKWSTTPPNQSATIAMTVSRTAVSMWVASASALARQALSRASLTSFIPSMRMRIWSSMPLRSVGSFALVFGSSLGWFSGDLRWMIG